MMSERESHGMNCAHRSDSDEPCTCACRYHAAVDTERTMHAAWRKRAEEAERENADLRARLEAAEKDRDNELADNTGLALKCAALAEECDNFKALASRETSRRLDAEKARDEQAEAVKRLGRVAAWMMINMDDPRIAALCLRLHVDGVEKLVPLVEALNTDWIDMMNNPTAAAAVKEASGG